MNPSKLVVIVIVVLILAGTAAWSWVNFVHTPEYDPEKAHLFLEHFYHRCNVEHSKEVCGDVIGKSHRSCFVDHLQPTPQDEVDERGPVIYDLPSYLRCMEANLEAGD